MNPFTNYTTSELALLLDPNASISRLVQLSILDLVAKKEISINEVVKQPHVRSRAYLSVSYSIGPNFHSKENIEHYELIKKPFLEKNIYSIQNLTKGILQQLKNPRLLKPYYMLPLVRKGLISTNTILLSTRMVWLNPKGKKIKRELKHYLNQQAQILSNEANSSSECQKIIDEMGPLIHLLSITTQQKDRELKRRIGKTIEGSSLPEYSILDELSSDTYFVIKEILLCFTTLKFFNQKTHL